MLARTLRALLLAAPLAAPGAAQQASGRTVEFSGQVLVNGFYNARRPNNADVPLFLVLPPASDSFPEGGVGATIRQTRLGVLVTDPQTLNGTFTGELDVDFFGGYLGNAGRTFPLPRIRRLLGRITWAHSELLFGQEAPPVADINPRSLASVGIPGFVNAGNLWFWIPQLRGTWELGTRFRLALQAAALAPLTGESQTPFTTRHDRAEQSGRPFLQGRVRFGWGPSDDPSELGIGVHQGWFATTGDSLLSSQAVVVSGRVKLGVAELRGEWYTGQGLAALGGGGIGVNFDSTAAPLDDKGGWLQLNFRRQDVFEFGGGCGLDTPAWDPAGAASAANRTRNAVCEMHVIWRQSGPLMWGLEYRRLETTYGGAVGKITGSHVNLQMGYRF